MKLYLVKPDLTYYEQYNDMIKEWKESNTKIAPWFLNNQFETIEEFAKYIKMLDDAENGIVDSKFSSATSYFVIDEHGKLIGATSLRHYLTIEGLNTWGHIGYGVRPTERKKGYATEMLKMTLEEAKKKNIYKILMGAHTANVGSCKVIEKCNGILENVVIDPNDSSKTINRYWINNM